MNDERPTHIDLFSGIGGFALAARQAGFRTVAFCEIEPYAQRVLAKNFSAVLPHDAQRGWGGIEVAKPRSDKGKWGRAAGGCGFPVISENIFDFDGTAYRGAALLTGGFPCQPFSVAGKRRGAADDRHLWPEMLRVIAEARPAWVLGENVPGFIPMELDNVLSQLEGIGYACRAFVIPACAVDARHRRDRLWIVGRDVADTECRWRREQLRTDSARQPLPETKRSQSTSWIGSEGENVADSISMRGEERMAGSNGIGEGNSGEPNDNSPAWVGQGNGDEVGQGNGDEVATWLTEPDVGRVAHGIPARVDRLRGLGNAIVPQVAFEILREIRRHC